MASWSMRASGVLAMADDRIEEALATTLLEIAQRRLGKGRGSATTVDGFGEELGLTLGADLFRDFLVVSASAFFNADSADGAAEDPIR